MRKPFLVLASIVLVVFGIVIATTGASAHGSGGDDPNLIHACVSIRRNARSPGGDVRILQPGQNCISGEMEIHWDAQLVIPGGDGIDISRLSECFPEILFYVDPVDPSRSARLSFACLPRQFTFEAPSAGGGTRQILHISDNVLDLSGMSGRNRHILFNAASYISQGDVGAGDNGYIFTDEAGDNIFVNRAGVIAIDQIPLSTYPQTAFFMGEGDGWRYVRNDNVMEFILDDGGRVPIKFASDPAIDISGASQPTITFQDDSDGRAGITYTNGGFSAFRFGVSDHLGGDKELLSISEGGGAGGPRINFITSPSETANIFWHDVAAGRATLGYEAANARYFWHVPDDAGGTRQILTFEDNLIDLSEMSGTPQIKFANDLAFTRSGVDVLSISDGVVDASNSDLSLQLYDCDNNVAPDIANGTFGFCVDQTSGITYMILELGGTVLRMDMSDFEPFP